MADSDCCGPDLEYDPDFLALEAELRGQPAQEFRDKDGAAILIAGQGIDWERVRVLAEALLGRSKDLRLAVWLTRARLHHEGIAGLAQGLALIAAWLEQHWEGVHPQFDAEDRSPTMRLNALAALNAPDAVLGDLRACLLPGPIPEPDGAVSEQARQALDRLQSISDWLLYRVGPERVPDFSRLRDTLQGLVRATGEALPSPGLSASGAPGAIGVSAAETSSVSGHGASVGSRAIQCRDDVVEMLEVLCQYLDQFEPGSPVQIMLRRACRMMRMTFLELIQELAPDGLGQVERAIGGSLGRESI